MSTDPEAYVRGELTNQLHKVDTAVDANDFVQAQRLLNAAYQIAGDFPVLREEVVEKDEEIRQIRHSRLREKLLEVERLLNQPDLFDEGRCGNCWMKRTTSTQVNRASKCCANRWRVKPRASTKSRFMKRHANSARLCGGRNKNWLLQTLLLSLS